MPSFPASRCRSENRVRPRGVEAGVESEIFYAVIMVVGLPLLFALLTGPGLWREKWG
jgi:hypothetical protein